MSADDLPIKEYLGDGVYITMDELGYIVMTTEDGSTATNTIYLERQVATALHEMLGKLLSE